MKLIQKHLLKGRREFELLDDAVFLRIKTPLKLERTTVLFSQLHPEPVLNQAMLEFHGRNDAQALISLWVDKPKAGEFTTFVDEMKKRILKEYSRISAPQDAAEPAGLAANVFDEPPEFAEPKDNAAKFQGRSVEANRLAESMEMLERHLDPESIKPLLSALQALIAEPDSPTRFEDLYNAFEALGIEQGAVLTYAPYISILLYDDPLGD